MVSTDINRNGVDLQRKTAPDRYEMPDFYEIDDLLTSEHLLIRQSIRDFVKHEISPIIEDCYEKAYFPYFMVKSLEKLVPLVLPYPQNMVAVAWITSPMVSSCKR